MLYIQKTGVLKSGTGNDYIYDTTNNEITVNGTVRVYGSVTSPMAKLTIASGATVTVPSGEGLIIASVGTLTIDGTLTIEGELNYSGKVNVSGTLDVSEAQKGQITGGTTAGAAIKVTASTAVLEIGEHSAYDRTGMLLGANASASTVTIKDSNGDEIVTIQIASDVSVTVKTKTDRNGFNIVNT